jgi:hypothetical protein
MRHAIRLRAAERKLQTVAPLARQAFLLVAVEESHQPTPRGPWA